MRASVENRRYGQNGLYGQVYKVRPAHPVHFVHSGILT